jgi:hypothetical protein
MAALTGDTQPGHHTRSLYETCTHLDARRRRLVLLLATREHLPSWLQAYNREAARLNDD